MAENYGVEAVFTAKDNMTGAVGKIRNALNGITESTQKVSASLGTILKGSLAFQVASKGADMLRDSISGAVSRFDTLNNFPRIMKTMGASTNDSRVAINHLKDGINGLPTALDTVAQTTERLFPAVGNDVQKAASSTLALNDAFIASGASSEDAARGLLQYTQMLSTGKVDMMSWRSLEETMPYALQKVAKSFGITSGSMSELYQKVQSGQITMKQLNDRFIELDAGANGFHQAALNATAGIGTAMANLKNRVTAGLADIVGALNQTVQKATGLNIGGWINTLSTGIKNTLDSISKKILAFAGTAKEMFAILKNAFSPVISAWKSAINAVIQAYTKMYASANRTEGLNAFRTVVQMTASALTSLANFVQNNAELIATLLQMVLKATLGFIAFKKALAIGASLASPFLSLASGIMRVNSAVSMFIGKGPVFAKAMLDGAKNGKEVTSGLEKLKTGFTEAISPIRRFGSEMGKLGTNIVTSGSTIRGTVTTVGRAIVSAFGPVGVALAVVGALVAAFAIMWSTNFMNIREVVSGFVNGIVSSISSMGSTIQPILEALGTAFNLLKPVISAVATVIGGVLMGALAALMVAISGIVDNMRGIVTGISTIIVAIKSLISAIANGGEAIGKFFKGDFKGAAQSAGKAIGSIKDGIKDIGKEWGNWASNSATSKTINSLSKIGKATDDDGKKAKNFSADWSSASKAIQSENEKIENSFKEVGQTMETAFSQNEGMKGYVQASETLMSNWADKQVEIQKKANSLMAEAEKAGGARRRQLQQQAIQAMLTDQSKGASQMLQIMNDNNKMLASGVATNGQKLTDEQKDALRKQNDVIRQGLEQQADMELKALQKKIALHQKWTAKDTQTEINALKQKNTAIQAELTSNASKERQLEQQLSTAKTATEKAGYTQQLNSLKQADQQKLAEIDSNNAEIINSMARSGQLTHQTFVKALNTMNISTKQGLQTMLETVNAHAGTIQERLLVMANYFGTSGKNGTSNFLKALASGNTKGAGKLLTAPVIKDLGDLPNSMFKGGEKGKKSFLKALKSGDYKKAGKQITDKFSAGIKEGTKSISKATKGIPKEASKGLKASSKEAKASGKKVATSFASGIDSGSKTVRKAGQNLTKEATSSVKSKTTSATSAGKSIGDAYAKGIKSASGAVKSASHSLGSSAASGFKGNASSATSAGKELGNSLLSGIKSVKSKIRTAGRSLAESMISGVKGKRGTAEDAGSLLGKAAVRGARSEHSAMVSAGSYLASGLASGITSNSGAIEAAAESAVARAVSAAKAKADIHSPSRVMRDEVGQWLAKGVAVGIDDYSSEAEQSANNLISNIKNRMSKESGFALDTSSHVSINAGGGLMSMLIAISQQLSQGQQIVLDTGALVGQTAPSYNKRLGQFVKNNGRYQL